jgi:hypothetical protein
MDRMYWMHFAINHPIIETGALLLVIAVFLGVNWWADR